MSKLLPIIMIGLLMVTNIALANEKPYKELNEQLQGKWVAGETFVAQPDTKLQQNIKEIIFKKDNVIEWTYTKNGKMVNETGRYFIDTLSTQKDSTRKILCIFVAPKRFKEPRLSSLHLLRLMDVVIDFDARFLIKKYGKVLKAKTVDGKNVLFVKSKGNS